jgi:hypothetical protein
VNSNAGQVYGWQVLEAMEQGCQFEVGQAYQIRIGRQLWLVQVSGRTYVPVLGSLYLANSPPFFLGKLLILGYIRLAPAPRQTSPGHKIKLPI